LWTGVSESGQGRKELPIDLKARGLPIALDIDVGDGGPGFWKALGKSFPSTRQEPTERTIKRPSGRRASLFHRRKKLCCVAPLLPRNET
jgi:hypothetical protein